MMTHDAKVVRFPLLRVLPEKEVEAHEAVPDVRVVLQMAEAFHLAAPDAGERDRAAAAMAAHVEANVPLERGARRDAALRALLLEAMERAAAARLVSEEAWAQAEAAQARLVELSQRRCDGGLEVLRQRADAQTCEAARLLLEAYTLSVQAAAAATVVGLARRGETWRPRSEQEEDDLSWAQPVRWREGMVGIGGQPGV